jgi:perosamine synthetase
MKLEARMNIPAARPYFRDSDIKSITEEFSSILKTGQLILGPYTKEFERSFREYCGVKHAVAVSSCTAALEICLRYYGIQGKEVIVPTNTFIATGNAVLYNAGSLVLADIKPDTLCLDPDEVIRRITDKTAGIIIVHIAGLPYPEIDILQEICHRRRLFLIEDAAHAHGATLNGQKTGSFADAGCFSFYPTKVMTTGTGGMLTTNDSSLAEYAISLRHYGVGNGLHHIVNLGYDWLMDEVSALLGIYQLKALDSNITRRNEIARRYSETLDNFEGIQIFRYPSNIRHSYYKYPLLLSPATDKKTFIEKMRTSHNISIGSVYDPPCHLQPLYQRLFGYYEGQFPVADTYLKRICCLPIYSDMTDLEIDYVIRSTKEIITALLTDSIKV